MVILGTRDNEKWDWIDDTDLTLEPDKPAWMITRHPIEKHLIYRESTSGAGVSLCGRKKQTFSIFAKNMARNIVEEGRAAERCTSCLYILHLLDDLDLTGYIRRIDHVEKGEAELYKNSWDPSEREIKAYHARLHD
ncbi:MAG: hypothetical protein MPK62_01935 [Alphaproteobacteria bacterium]|nr:hypothetical protein [Alphaproteobacteria bacterium]MDA8029894.1 hypothetical protein [Alphaproteobacteria bacterium]